MAGRKMHQSTLINAIRRYQVVTYHSIENGFDEKKEYPTLKEAACVASGYVAGIVEPDGFAYEGAAVYDLQNKKYLRIFGYFPING